MIVPSDFADRHVCILGLGYVGLTLATAMAGVGFRVTGVEIREDVVEGLRLRRPHFHEPGLADQLSRALDRGALTVHRTVPSGCDATAYIITVGTPLGPDGRSRMDMIENVARETAAAMPDGSLVVLRSTVKLGTSNGIVAPVLNGSGRRYDLAFCPERTLEGVALRELRSLPQIVGGESDRAALRAAQIFQFLTPTIVRVRDLETAEMIKLVDNAQRDVSFAFANEVARMCDAVGISALDVIQAGKLGYPRTNLPMPGPVGGPCLEKDPYILAEGLVARGLRPEIVLAARAVNERQPAEAMAALHAAATSLPGFSSTPKIAILGLAFKGRPETDDLRGTMARPIVQALRGLFPDASFVCFDPVIAPEQIAAFGLMPATSLANALDGSSLAVITNNHPLFAGMPLETMTASMATPAFVYDFWNNFDARDLCLPFGVGYMALGAHGCARMPEGAGT
jgi:UDP-N-acetyl-D-mannosaminuronic acid dehydrogenase